MDHEDCTQTSEQEFKKIGEIIKKLDKNEKGSIETEIVLNSSINKNKNDLIFLILLITYVLIFYFNKKKNEK